MSDVYALMAKSQGLSKNIQNEEGFWQVCHCNNKL